LPGSFSGRPGKNICLKTQGSGRNPSRKGPAGNEVRGFQRRKKKTTAGQHHKAATTGRKTGSKWGAIQLAEGEEHAKTMIVNRARVETKKKSYGLQLEEWYRKQGRHRYPQACRLKLTVQKGGTKGKIG